MTVQTILILFSIGISAGILSGFVGVGGWIIIVPGLVVINYWKSGDVNWKYGLIIALTFFIGAYFGSKLSLKLQPGLVKFLFGVLMAIVSVKLILSGYTSISSDGD